MMSKINMLIMALVFVLMSISVGYSTTTEQVRVQITEFVTQNVSYEPLGSSSGTWAGPQENITQYLLSGTINISNENNDGVTISDIYVKFDNISRISTPILESGRNGTLTANGDEIVIHIFELEGGESSLWNYSINTTLTRPPINITSNYSDSKLLAGDNLTVWDTITNTFDNATHSDGTCIYNLFYDQSIVPIFFTGANQNFSFENASFESSDTTTNSLFSTDTFGMNWSVRNGACLNLTQDEYIRYQVITPSNIPTTQVYDMISSTLSYSLNNTVSHLRVVDVYGLASEGIVFGQDKQIIQPSHPTLYGSNVTWNSTGFVSTVNNISYNVTSFTLWVAQRSGVSGDPNLVDNDTISNATLEITYNPNTVINLTNSFSTATWLFNYSDLPTPIVYSRINFSIHDDGTQIVNRSVTVSNNEVFIKEIYLILGYWLDVEKNVTSLGNDVYRISVNVSNKGNQATPEGSPVTVYDFIPAEFNLSGTGFNYSVSPWYTTTNSSSVVTGVYNGTMHAWAIIPTNTVINTSFAPGPTNNINTTWWVTYNVTGTGEYSLLDVFVVGVDPQKVDGAGASKQVFVSEFVEKFKSTEGVFAAIASLMLVLGLVV